MRVGPFCLFAAMHGRDGDTWSEAEGMPAKNGGRGDGGRAAAEPSLAEKGRDQERSGGADVVPKWG